MSELEQDWVSSSKEIQNPPGPWGRACGRAHVYSEVMGGTSHFCFPNCETPKISFCREDTGITGNFFTEVVYHRCKKLLVPKGQSPGASGSDQPNPTPPQARAHVLLSCSQARVQSGKSCHSSEREVSMGEELTAETRTAAFSGRIEKEPGGDRAAPPLRLRD